MSDLRWLTDYKAWSEKGRVWGPVAAVVAFLFFLLTGWGWFWSLILALLVLVAVVWFTRDSSAGAEPWKDSTPPAPFVPTPAPAKPVVAPVADAASEVAVDTAAAEAAASERVRAAARAAGEAARLMDAPVDAVRPARLDGPRGGVADDLKKIKGVGPKLEALLNSLGYYHFDQIGGWGAQEVAWVDSNLEGFSGRVTRDDWVAQARLLAAGGATEFSERVDRGEVYDD